MDGPTDGDGDGDVMRGGQAESFPRAKRPLECCFLPSTVASCIFPDGLACYSMCPCSWRLVLCLSTMHEKEGRKQEPWRCLVLYDSIGISFSSDDLLLLFGCLVLAYNLRRDCAMVLSGLADRSHDRLFYANACAQRNAVSTKQGWG